MNSFSSYLTQKGMVILMKKIILTLILLIVLLTGCVSQIPEDTEQVPFQSSTTDDLESSTIDDVENSTTDDLESSTTDKSIEISSNDNETDDTIETLFEGYELITVDGGDQSGVREANVVVDIGYGDRAYWAFTNEYGQLVKVIAEEILLQDDSIESVTSKGRYYSDEANVPGTELVNYDQGHVIADSLGGVSNAYNITPQESTLNRYGDQAYMEKNIRDAGGCTNFEAVITYPNTTTQIPTHYHYTYTLMGNVIVEDFDNVNPDEVNKALVDNTTEDISVANDHDISSIDTNGNGKVTIAEAKAAGFKMPITSDHWLYQFMDDRDGDGMVGE